MKVHQTELFRLVLNSAGCYFASKFAAQVIDLLGLTKIPPKHILKRRAKNATSKGCTTGALAALAKGNDHEEIERVVQDMVVVCQMDRQLVYSVLIKAGCIFHVAMLVKQHAYKDTSLTVRAYCPFWMLMKQWDI